MSRFYTAQGQQINEVPKSKGGGTRTPTIADARANGWYPSWTTVARMLNAQQLNQWRENQVAQAAWDIPKDGKGQDQWQREVFDQSNETSRVAADIGTAIHGEIEEWLNSGTEPSSVAAINAVRWLKGYLAEYPDAKVECEKRVVAPMFGWAGTVDLTIISQDVQIVADFKTTCLRTFKKPYKKWGYQLAAYSMALGVIPTALHSIVIDRDNGEVKLYSWGQMWKRTQSPDFPALCGGAKALFELYCLENGYDPREK